MLVLFAPVWLDDFLELDDPVLLISTQHLADLHFDIERLYFFLIIAVTRLLTLLVYAIKIAVPTLARTL